MTSHIPSAPIHSLRIDEGCIACSHCEDLVPAVFEVSMGADCRVRHAVLEKVARDHELRDAVHEAADSCPVEVILVNRPSEVPIEP